MEVLFKCCGQRPVKIRIVEKKGGKDIENPPLVVLVVYVEYVGERVLLRAFRMINPKKTIKEKYTKMNNWTMY